MGFGANLEHHLRNMAILSGSWFQPMENSLKYLQAVKTAIRRLK